MASELQTPEPSAATGADAKGGAVAAETGGASSSIRARLLAHLAPKPRDPTTPCYRCYLINAAGFKFEGHALACDSDEAAIAAAREKFGAYGFEIWSGPSKIYSTVKTP